MNDMVREMMLGKNGILLPSGITNDMGEMIVNELMHEIVNLDIRTNSAIKMYTVNEIVRVIQKASTGMGNITLYIDDDYKECGIYRKAPDIRSNIQKLINQANTLSDKRGVYETLCRYWASILVINHQDICKETNSMILDLREGKNLYYIVKK